MEILMYDFNRKSEWRQEKMFSNEIIFGIESNTSKVKKRSILLSDHFLTLEQT